MSPVLARPATMHFPPTFSELKTGVALGRRGRAPAPHPYPVRAITDTLRSKVITTESSNFLVTDAIVHMIAPPLASEHIGETEMYFELLLAPAGAALAAHPSLGTGGPDEADAKLVKSATDGSATDGMVRVYDSLYADLEIFGGEGGGRDKENRKAALYLRRKLGRGYGSRFALYTDPLEVTNGTRKFDPRRGHRGVGEGWHPSMVDPVNWNPGYSGVSSLMLAVNRKDGDPRRLSDDLYLDKSMVRSRVASLLRQEGINMRSHSVAQQIAAISRASGVALANMHAAALARTRHDALVKEWMRSGLINIEQLSDGDAMFTSSIVSGGMHLIGGTGGVVEGLTSAASGIALGAKAYMQFVAAERLKDGSLTADIMLDNQRFNFTETEFQRMYGTKLFDSQNITPTLRLLRDFDELYEDLDNSAADERDISGFNFDGFKAEYRRAVGYTDHEKNYHAPEGDSAFSEPSMIFLRRTLNKLGFMDVRGIYEFNDFVPTHDWLYAAAALTPNKFAPLNGIQSDGENSIVELLVCGGSNVSYILELHVRRL